MSGEIKKQGDGGLPPSDPPRVTPILHGSAADILTFVLSVTAADSEQVQSKFGPRRVYTREIDTTWKYPSYAYGPMVKKRVAPALTQPVFVPTTNPRDFEELEDFREAVKKEVTLRTDQKGYYRAVEELMTEVDMPDQLGKIVDVFAFLQQHTKGKDEFMSPEVFGIKLVECGVNLVTDPIDGDANPSEAAQIAFPAVAQLLERQYYLRMPKEEKRGIGEGFSDLFAKSPNGTADSIAALRVRQMLHEAGYEGFEDTDRSERNTAKIGSSERYISASTVKKLKDAKILRTAELPKGGNAIGALTMQVSNILRELKERGFDNADKFIKGLDRLHHDSVMVESGRSTLNDLIQIANLLVPLIKNWVLKEDADLVPFNENEIKDLPYAMQRVLFAIHPDVLREATETSVAEGSRLHLRMVYINALMQQLTDYRGFNGPTVGDFVLHLIARGDSDARIAEKLEQVMGKPDDRATNLVKDTYVDSRQRRNSFYRLKMPGRGLYS